jgi:hypothetical protein
VAAFGRVSDDIDVTTLAFGPDGASPAGSRSVIRDVNGDGFLDLLAKYRTEESGISPGDPGACLKGALLDGTAFEGSDAIRIVPPRSVHATSTRTGKRSR